MHTLQKPRLPGRSKSAIKASSPIVRELFQIIDGSGFTYESITASAGYHKNQLCTMKNGHNAPLITCVENIGAVLGYKLVWVKL